MVCDHCGAEESVIHLTQIVDNEMRTLHLCPACAEEQGVEGMQTPADSFPLADFLAKMGPGFSGGEGGSLLENPEGGLGESEPVDEDEAGYDAFFCPFCKTHLGELRKSGRMGCPECWSAFEPRMRRLLRRIHGSHQHVGKVYLSPDPTSSEKRRRVSGLRRKLQRAVELEDFERAAELRDEIRALDKVGAEDPQ